MRLLVLLIATAASAQSGPVHSLPQRGAEPPREEWPLYYPLSEMEAGEEPTADSPEHLLWQLRELHSSLRQEEALAVAERLVALVPERPIGHYNHACVLARLRRVDAAVEALGRAVDAGWRNVEHTALDPDLASLRPDGRLSAVLARMRDLRAAEQPPAVPLRTGPWKEVIDDLKLQAPQIMGRYRLPGAALALLRDGEVVWTGGFGVDNARGGTPVDGDSRFRLVAPVDLLALMASYSQEDAGKLAVVQLIGFSNEVGPQPVDRARGEGLPASALLVGERGEVDPAGRDERSRVRGADLLRLLQLAVEITSNETFGVYCRKQILEPAGADRTSLAEGAGVEADVVWGHTLLGTPVPAAAAAGGALVTTAGDLARIMARSGRTADGLSAAAELGALGLSVRVRETRDGPLLEVADDRRPTGCLMQWYPRQRIGVVVLFNGQGAGDAARHLAHAALGGR